MGEKDFGKEKGANIIESDLKAVNLLGQWDVKVEGSKITINKPATHFAKIGPSIIDLASSPNLTRAKLYVISDSQVGLMTEFGDGKIRNLVFEKTDQGVKEIME